MDSLPQSILSELNEEEIQEFIDGASDTVFSLFCDAAKAIALVDIPADQELLVAVGDLAEFGIYVRASPSGAAHRLIVYSRGISVSPRNDWKGRKFTHEELPAALALFQSYIGANMVNVPKVAGPANNM